MSREKIKKIIIEFLGTIVGSAVMAFGVSSFLLPNQLSSGGFSGVATITVLFIKHSYGINDYDIECAFIYIGWI